MICLKHKQKYGKGEWCIYCGNPNDNTVTVSYMNKNGRSDWLEMSKYMLKNTHNTVKKVQIEDYRYLFDDSVLWHERPGLAKLL